MKWEDNLLLEGELTPELLDRGQFQLAMYALHLSSGNSIYCKQIKSSTVKDYVFAAASFLALFTGTDFRKDCNSDSHMGHRLAPVFRDLAKFEAVPNRQEPYDSRLHLLARQDASQFPPDELIPALVDGFEQGYNAGYRLSEWAQPRGLSDPTRYQLNHDVGAPIRTRAMVPVDFRIQTGAFQRASGLAILGHPLPTIVKMWAKWRTQKNGQNGEEKVFTRNPRPDGICYVASVYRSLLRFRRLQLLDSRLDERKTPLSVYWDPIPRCVKLITSDEIEGFMRQLAVRVYKLCPRQDREAIQRWSSHSLRIGACVALHALGFSGLDIQWILRWRSTAFLVYLRNVAILATRHHEALDRAAASPHLI